MTRRGRRAYNNNNDNIGDSDPPRTGCGRAAFTSGRSVIAYRTHCSRVIRATGPSPPRPSVARRRVVVSSRGQNVHPREYCTLDAAASIARVYDNYYGFYTRMKMYTSRRNGARNTLRGTGRRGLRWELWRRPRRDLGEFLSSCRAPLRTSGRPGALDRKLPRDSYYARNIHIIIIMCILSIAAP